MLDYNDVILIKKTYPTMHCSDVDFYKQYTTLQERTPDIIYEIGVGSGEWIVAMEECLDYSPLWIGIENFASAYKEVEEYGPLPKSPSELVDAIRLDNFIHYYTIHEPILGDIGPCRAGRLDMNPRDGEFKLITHECELLFIDDVFKPLYKFRLEKCLEVSDMKILWEGEKEVCLIRD